MIIYYVILVNYVIFCIEIAFLLYLLGMLELQGVRVFISFLYT